MKTLFLMYVVFSIAAMNQAMTIDRELAREAQRLMTTRSNTSRVDQNNNNPREPNRNSSNSSSNSNSSNSSSNSNR